MKIKRHLSALISICVLGNLGFVQTPKGDNYPDASGGENHIVLIPDLANATRDSDGNVKIPFTLKNNSGKLVKLGFTGHCLDGLAIVDQAGQIRFIQYIGSPQNWGGAKSGPSFRPVLQPGESTSDFYSDYEVTTLAAVGGRKIFGVLSGGVIGGKYVTFYSAPFLVPPELTKLPWIDLGEQNYLELTYDLSNASFAGGSLAMTAAKELGTDSDYAESLRKGWANGLFIPISIKNISNQDVVVANDDIRFYIFGNEKDKQHLLRNARWDYIKVSAPVLKSGESVSSTGRDYIMLTSLEASGYKPGDKIIAVVGGRISGTNKIIECYSSPFTLPPLPKSGP